MVKGFDVAGSTPSIVIQKRFRGGWPGRSVTYEGRITFEAPCTCVEGRDVLMLKLINCILRDRGN